MVVVRLSKTADKKKAISEVIQRSAFLSFVFTNEVMGENPLCRSTNSTMVIAPNRKNKISAVLPIM